MLALYFILICQVIYLTSINLFQLDRFLGYDSSAVYLQAIQIWNQGTFLIDNWIYTSTLTWDSPLLFAVPLYGLLGNIFTAFGISITLCIFLFLCVAKGILTQLNASKKARMIFYICFFTPFVSFPDSFNRIDYYAVMLSIFGVYTLRTAIVFLVWYMFLRLDRPLLGPYTKKDLKKESYLTFFSLACVLFTGISSGYNVLLFGIVPPLAYAIIRNSVRDSWKKNNITALVFLACSTFLCILGKFIDVNLIGHTSHENSLGWTELFQFWTNFWSISEGYLLLTGALPVWESPSAFSKEGITVGFFLALSLGLLCTGICAMVQSIKEKKDTVAQYYSFVFFSMLLFFVFIFTKYGAQFFEIRYLIPNFILLMMFASLWLAKILEGKNKSLRVLLSYTVFPTIIVVNIASYDFISESYHDVDLTKEMIAYVADHESPVIHLLGYDIIIMGQNIRVYDQEKVYLWSNTGYEFTYSGDYDYYTDASEYTGPTLLISSQADFEKLPLQLKGQYQHIHNFSAAYCLYEAKTNPIDYSVGFNHREFNVDYPYTDGITVADYGEFQEDGSYHVQGYGDVVLWGPNEAVPQGIYDITLHYEVLSEEPDTFIGTLDCITLPEIQVLKETSIPSYKTSVTLYNVDFSQAQGLNYEYRVILNGNAEISIHSIELKKKNT